MTTPIRPLTSCTRCLKNCTAKAAASTSSASRRECASAPALPANASLTWSKVEGPLAGPLRDGSQGPRAYWLSPRGLVMLAATGVALAIRLYLLTRLRYLTGITEYDDGVYLGGAVSLVSGILPYHGFAFVQPRAGVQLDGAEVVGFARGRLADYKVPRYVELVDGWPMTATGKIERFRLSQMARELAADRPPLRARS